MRGGVIWLKLESLPEYCQGLADSALLLQRIDRKSANRSRFLAEAAERALASDTPPAKKRAAKPARVARKRRARA